MMDTISWHALLVNAPSALAVIITVIVFLRFMESKSRRDEKLDIVRMSELERIGQACHEHTRELNERATKAIDKAAMIIDNNTKIIGAIERKMNGSGR